MRKLASIPIYFYRACVKPLFPRACGFYPSCSAYTLEYIKRHGAVIGWTKGVWRILRCNPLKKHKGDNYDPVPIGIKGHAKWVI